MDVIMLHEATHFQSIFYSSTQYGLPSILSEQLLTGLIISLHQHFIISINKSIMLTEAHTALVKATLEVQKQCSIQAVHSPAPQPIQIKLPIGYSL